MLINIDAMLDNFDSDGFYVLDCKNKNEENILNKAVLADKTVKVNKESVGIKAMYNQGNMSSIVFILFLFCLLVSAGVVLYFWFYGHKYEISVKILCGISDRDIFKDLLKEYAVIWGLGYIGAGTVTMMLTKGFSNLNVLLFITVTCICFILFMAPVFIFLKSWTNRLLR